MHYILLLLLIASSPALADLVSNGDGVGVDGTSADPSGGGVPEPPDVENVPPVAVGTIILQDLPDQLPADYVPPAVPIPTTPPLQ